MAGGIIAADTFAANWPFVAVIALLVGERLWNGRKQKETRDEVSQINRQVNHVKDPENEPTLRELVVATHQQVQAVQIEVAAVGARQASTERKIDAHLAAHQAAEDAGGS